MGKLYKASVRLRSVSRAGNAARGHAMRGPEPRAPELEIPRPMGAGTARNDGTNVNLVGWLRKTTRGDCSSITARSSKSAPFPGGGTPSGGTSPVGTGARGRRGGEAPRGAEPMTTPGRKLGSTSSDGGGGMWVCARSASRCSTGTGRRRVDIPNICTHDVFHGRNRPRALEVYVWHAPRRYLVFGSRLSSFPALDDPTGRWREV